MPIAIEPVDAESTFPLRRAVLRNGTADPSLSHDHAPSAFHLAARDGVAGDDGAIVGVVGCVLRPNMSAPDGYWQLFAMAVDAACRKRGVGRMLVEALIERVRASGGIGVWANSREEAVGFYQSLGFEQVGERFLGWNDIPHFLVLRPV